MSLCIEKHEDERWLVVRTRSRCEKKFAEYCLKHQITHYLPIRRSVRRYARKVVEFTVPIFGGYVFAQIDPSRQPELMESPAAARVIVPDDAMELTLIDELNDIRIIERAALMQETFVRPEIRIGRRVTVKSGPLAGLNGIVSRRRTKTRITVNVELVGQSVNLDVDSAEVEIEF